MSRPTLDYKESRDSLPIYMSPDNFMFHLSLFLSIKNIDARKKLDLSAVSLS